MHVAQIKRALGNQVDHTAWRAHDHIYTLADAANLAGVRLPTIDGKDAHTQVAAHVEDGLGHLHRQLTCRRHHQPLRRELSWLQAVQHRKGKRGRLAGAGLGLTNDIVSFKQHGDDGRLNGGGFCVAQIGYRLHQLWVQVQLRKSVVHLSPTCGKN